MGRLGMIGQEKSLQTLGLQAIYGRYRMFIWWAHQDSNLEPTGYEPVALTNCAMSPFCCSGETRA